MRGAWNRLKARCETCARTTLVGGVVLLTMAVAVVLLAGGALGLAWTNTEKFCIGCHEMRDNVYAEFQETIHDRNRSGVRAVCSDCHVPREPIPMLKRKIAATMEIWGKITGKINTKEKFEAHRYELAKRVWVTMKKNDSQECRNCHNEASFDPDKQTEKAQDRHKRGKAEGKTCIECHFGIAHKEPDGPGPQEFQISKQ